MIIMLFEPRKEIYIMPLKDKMGTFCDYNSSKDTIVIAKA